jgi:hypothetical protein
MATSVTHTRLFAHAFTCTVWLPIGADTLASTFCSWMIVVSLLLSSE